MGFLENKNLYEHSTKVPFIVSGPDIPEGEIISSPIYLQDVMPSTLALARVKKPKHVRFNNILPLARGKTKTSPYKEIYGAYLQLQRSITIENFKMITYPNVPIIRLFDLKNDPYETNDLALTQMGKRKIKQMLPRLFDLQKEMNDPLDLTKTFEVDL